MFIKSQTWVKSNTEVFNIIKLFYFMIYITII